MIPAIIGRKLGMTQVFREDGRAEAVTVVDAGPCTVVQVKTAAKEGVATGWSWTIKADNGGCQEFGLPTYQSAVESVLRFTPETA